MTEGVRELISAIASGDSIAIEQAFNTEIAERISNRLDDMRVEVAQNMFKESVEEVELTEEEIVDQMIEDILDEEIENFMMSEDFEQLDELKRSTLVSYVRKGLNDREQRKDASRHFNQRADDMRKVSHEVGTNIGRGAAKDEIDAKRREYQDKADHHEYKAIKRTYGVDKALKKLSKEEYEALDEVLSKAAPASSWIKDFVDSDNPKFAGKSKEKRKQMALAAYYAKQRDESLDVNELLDYLNEDEEVLAELLESCMCSHSSKKTVQEKELSPKQKKIAALGGDKSKLDAADFAALRAGKKVNEEAEQLDETMTRKHFQQVADVIKAHPDQEKRNELAKHHAEIFKASNPRFDHDRFYAAAGANIK